MSNGAQYLPSAGEGPVPQWHGVYPGYIAVNDDPLALGRVKLRVPQVFGGTTSGWASPHVPVAYIPTVGTAVTVQFLGGDPAQPVWGGNFATASAGGTVTVGNGAPTTPGNVVGDVYYDTAGGTQNGMYVWNGVTWVKYDVGASALEPASITAAQIAASAGILGTQLANSTISLANLASDVTGAINSKNAVTIGQTLPASAKVGDVWIQTSSAGAITNVYECTTAYTSGGVIGDWTLESAVTARSLGAPYTYQQSTTPNTANNPSNPPQLNDLWINTSSGNVIEQMTGGTSASPTWTQFLFGLSALGADVTGSISAKSQVTMGPSIPASGKVGDVWIQTNLTTGVVIAILQCTTAYASGGTQAGNWATETPTTARALGAAYTYQQSATPNTANNASNPPVIGDLWINTSSGNVISQMTAGTSASPTWTQFQFSSGALSSSAGILGTQIANTTITGANIVTGTITANLINTGDSLNPNPYFGGGDTSSWNTYANSGPLPTFTAIPTTGGFGYPWCANVAAGAGSAFPQIYSTSFAVNAGDPVQVNGWFNTNADLQFTIGYAAYAGGPFVSQTVVTVGADAGVWQYAAIVGNVPGGATAANLSVKVSSGSTAGTEVFQATGLTVLSKVHGGLIEAGTITADQIRAGTITANELNTAGSLNPNPNFSGSLAGWFASGSGTMSLVSGITGQGFAYAGEYIAAAGESYPGIESLSYPSVSPNDPAFAYGYINATNDTDIVITWFGSGGTWLGNAATTVTANPGVWQYAEVSGNAPAGATQANLSFNLNSGSTTAGDTFQASAGYLLTKINGGVIEAGTINTAQLNANAINGMTITGAKFIGNGSGDEFVLYNGTPGLDELTASVVTSALTDAYGNIIPRGFTLWDQIGIPAGGGTEYWAVNIGTRLSMAGGSNSAAIAFGYNTTGYNTAFVPQAYVAYTDGQVLEIVAPQMSLSTTAAPLSISGTAAIPVQIATDTWHTMTLTGGWTVGSGGVARYKLNADNTVSVHCSNLLPGTLTSNTSIWTQPTHYVATSTATQNFPVVVVSATAQGNTPFVAVRAGTITIQNFQINVTGLSFFIRYALD